MNEWQPIETAPKSGIYILVFGDPYCQMHVVKWIEELGRFGEIGIGITTYDLLTHWMHLPNSPTE